MLPVAESAFQESTDKQNLVFDAQGNWVRLSAKGSAGLADDFPNSRESALMIASLRAERTQAEFFSSRVKSKTTVCRIAKGYTRNIHSAEPADDKFAIDSEAAPTAVDENIAPRRNWYIGSHPPWWSAFRKTVQQS